MLVSFKAMPFLTNRRSYTETVEGRRRFFSRLKIVLLVFIAYELLAGLFITAYSISSRGMEPVFKPGDDLLATPLLFGPETLFGKIPAPVKPQRGELVLVEPPYAERLPFWTSIGDSLLRFFTFQRLSLAGESQGGSVAGPFVERVIALPGDYVAMEDFVFKVRPAGEEHFLTEFELSSLRYDIVKPGLPEGWTSSYPLSGHMEARVLGKDEYFVAGDNRGASSDSRLWGPVGIGRFKAKVFLRYWPLGRFGAP